jgi:cytoskeletal protein CcmA (bactofilin family)
LGAETPSNSACDLHSVKGEVALPDKSKLGRDALVVGRLSGAGELTVGGRFEGEIVWEGEVLVAAEADVRADGRVARLDLRGAWRGRLLVTQEALVRPGATWIGAGETPCLATEAGARMEGDFRVRPSSAAGSEPMKA